MQYVHRLVCSSVRYWPDNSLNNMIRTVSERVYIGIASLLAFEGRKPICKPTPCTAVLYEFRNLRLCGSVFLRQAKLSDAAGLCARQRIK